MRAMLYTENTERNQTMCKEEIKATVLKYAQQIHDQDEKEFRNLWTGRDTDILISGANIFRGIDSIYNDFLAGLIHNAYESISLIPDDLEINLLNEDTAAAVFRYHTECIRRTTKEPYVMKGIETQVLIRIGGCWKIAHIQYHGKSADA